MHEAMAACIRRAFGHPDSFSPERLDWDHFKVETLRQGVGPMLYVGVEALGTEVPDDVRRWLHSTWALIVFRARVHVEPALRTVIGALTAQDIDPILLKGPALAYTAYPQVSFRTFSDIDLLLESAELDRAATALERLGYAPLSGFDAHGHHHLAPYVSPDGNLTVELHYDIVPQPHPYRINLDQLRERAERREIADMQLRVMSPMDALHHACVHLAWGHRYTWYPLRNLTDILAITQNQADELDWHAFVETVSQARTAGSVYWPLRLSKLWLGAPVPAAVLSTLAPARSLRRLAEPVLMSSYALDNEAPPEVGTEVLYNAVREVSLYGALPLVSQLWAMWQCLFPSREGVGHLAPDETRSRLAYSAYLSRPGRLVRGVVATARLLAAVCGHPVSRSTTRMPC
jgi:hypothetical protein